MDTGLVLSPQVSLNQLALAPVTLAAVFTWNLTLTGQTAALAGKIQRDLVPSMINGEPQRQCCTGGTLNPQEDRTATCAIWAVWSGRELCETLLYAW